MSYTPASKYLLMDADYHTRYIAPNRMVRDEPERVVEQSQEACDLLYALNHRLCGSPLGPCCELILFNDDEQDDPSFAFGHVIDQGFNPDRIWGSGSDS